MTTAYIFLTVVGGGYVLTALLMGHAHFGDSGHGGAHDHGGHPSEVQYGVSGGGKGSASAGPMDSPVFHFPFFSPLALATLFAALGAWGLIAQQGFGASDGTSLTIAIPAAVLTAYLVTYAGWRLVAGSTGSSQIRLDSLQGALGEVITPIPAGGAGEVAAVVQGQRFAGPAREADGKEVPRGARVRIQSMVGSTLVVKKEE